MNVQVTEPLSAFFGMVGYVNRRRRTSEDYLSAEVVFPNRPWPNNSVWFSPHELSAVSASPIARPGLTAARVV